MDDNNTAPAAPTQTTTPPKETTVVGFAITVQLGDPPQDVTLTAPTTTDVAKTGMYFALPPGATVTLGTLKDLIGWLNQQLASVGVTIPTDANGWPSALADIFNGILNTRVTVNRFAVAQDPKPEGATDSPPLRFDLEVTGVAMDPADPTKIKAIPVFGLFKVVGGGIALTHSYENAPDTWTAVPSGAAPKALPDAAPATP